MAKKLWRQTTNYAKRKFIDPVVKAQNEWGCDIAIVGKLRKDADLYYLYQGERSGKRGRPKELDGKVDFKDYSRWGAECA